MTNTNSSSTLASANGATKAKNVQGEDLVPEPPRVEGWRLAGVTLLVIVVIAVVTISVWNFEPHRLQLVYGNGELKVIQD
jgi:hypothetical protein